MKVTALTQLSAAAALVALSGTAFAQTKAPEPDYTLSFNAGAVTDYRYRGISQSRLKPAVQGGADFAHKSGVYLGFWGTTIKWVKDGGGDASVELDFYGGYKGEAAGIAYDVGVLHYQYPSNKLAVIANPTELYVAGTMGPATLKYSQSVTNLFGFADSKGSYYVDLSATFDLGSGFTLVPHVGYQSVKNNSTFSYTDYSITLAKDLGNGLSATAALIGTDSRDYVAPNGKNLGRDGLVLGIKYTF